MPARKILAPLAGKPKIPRVGAPLSQTAASLILVVAMLVVAVYLLFEPPPGLDDGAYRALLPFLLFAAALNIFENIRIRAHISQLVGALRMLAGRMGRSPTPEIKGEAIEILIGSLRSGTESVRDTAAKELRKLTDEDLGTDPEAWQRWWLENKDRFR